jgi:hypothetical protein
MQSWRDAIRHNIELRSSFYNSDSDSNSADVSLPELSTWLAKLQPWAGDAAAQNQFDECVRFVEVRCKPGESVLKVWRVKYGPKGTFKRRKEGVAVLTSLSFYR